VPVLRGLAKVKPWWVTTKAVLYLLYEKGVYNKLFDSLIRVQSLPWRRILEDSRKLVGFPTNLTGWSNQGNVHCVILDK